MNVLRNTRRIKKQAEETTDGVTDRAASENISTPNGPWTRKAQAGDEYEIKPGDVGKTRLKMFGRSWKVEDFMGRVMPQDVGKLVYYSETYDSVQVENDEQFKARTRKAARPAMRKAGDPRIEWFKRNPAKLKGRFVNAGGLVGFVVGTGKVGNTNMVGLKIRDAHGKIDVADLSSLKSVDQDDAADQEAGVLSAKAARPAMRKAGNFLSDRSRVPDQARIDRGRTPQFLNGAKPGDKITTRLNGSFEATYTLRSKTNPFDGGTEFYYQWSAMGEQSRSDDEYPTIRELNQALANTHRIQMAESKEEADASKAARPAMRKATGDTAFDALFDKYWAKDYWGWEDQAQDESIKERERAKAKAMVDKVRRELTTGDVSDYARSLVRSSQVFVRSYLARKDGAPATGGAEQVLDFYADKFSREMDGGATAKAAVIDPKIAIVGTPFDARARIINKTNGRLLKSKSFAGRFAKATARAWADAEVKKLL